MDGKKGSIEINIRVSPNTAKQLETGKKHGNVEFLCETWLQKLWCFCKEDSSRVIFSLKVGLAVLLVSLLVLFEAPYQIFGSNIIWAILTVILVFEYTVGATFNRGFNRAMGSLLAGVLAIVVAQAALSSGHVAEPIIMGISIFLIGAITTFMKLWPSLAPYEYGFRVVLVTYCLIIVSGYRMGNPIRTTMDRLYSIAIGGLISLVVNVFVCPIWAGDQLHTEMVKHFDFVADALEECVNKYLQEDGSDDSEISRTIMDEFPDEPAYKRCRNTLNSAPKLETLADSAKWEPPHGNFLHFFYPWPQYVKVGAVLRYCAYEVVTLHSILHSEIQAPYNLRIAFRSEIKEASSQAVELVRNLGRDISNMKRSRKNFLVKRVHSSTEKLQHAIDLHSYLLASNKDPSHNFSKPLPKLSHALSVSSYSGNQPDRMAVVENNRCKGENTNLPAQDMSTGTLTPALTGTYHEMLRKQSRRLCSWPSREVDAFEEEGNSKTDFLPKMRALESTAALTLANFTSTFIEFVARLDYLVEEVDRLATMAKFKHEAL